MGCPLQKNYTSHYTLVTKKQANRDICYGDKDYEAIEGMTNYYPVGNNNIILLIDELN